ncbi:hypothetical protein DPMN_060346 [Dreissena polymorpha]|uniref:SAM domain-containing protein n=1 Tax=Dreissena polymorpha TaxID=45954 RepID=A0A9D4C5R8_DREPO|nr:hypothetical protein DPMN_060346 [Dreissena polymorpha]
MLRNEELYTREALALITESDLKCLGVPLGNVKVIVNNIKTWNTPATTSKCVTGGCKRETTNEDILLDACKTLDTLYGDQNIPTKSTKQFNAHMNPRTFLAMKATSKKAVHIKMFLTEKCKRRRQNRRKEFVLRSGKINQKRW